MLRWFTFHNRKASIYVSSHSKTLIKCLHIHISTYILCCGKTESAEHLTYIYVSHILLSSYILRSSYQSPDICLQCYIFFFPLPWRQLPSWWIICHFFAISPPHPHPHPPSIQFWCSPFVQSLLFPFYYLFFHLSSNPTKPAMEINSFYPSFSPEITMRSVMPLPYPVFHQILLFPQNSCD